MGSSSRVKYSSPVAFVLSLSPSYSLPFPSPLEEYSTAPSVLFLQVKVFGQVARAPVTLGNSAAWKILLFRFGSLENSVFHKADTLDISALTGPSVIHGIGGKTDSECISRIYLLSNS